MLRAVPGTGSEWVTAVGQISGVFLALAEVEAEGHTLPEPLRARRALRAWARLKTPVMATVRVADPDDASAPVAVLVPAADVDTIGAAARTLGRVLCHHRVHSTGGEAAGVLLHEAGVHAITPEQLVAQLARVHGVLDVEHPAGNRGTDLARDIWRAGS